MEQPKIVKCGLGTIREPQKRLLDNKVPLYQFNVGSEEIVRIDFIFDAGEINSELPMVAPITNMMLKEGTVSMKAEELNEKLDFHGIMYNLFCSYDKAGLSLLCLNKYLENALELASDMLIRPSFGEKELTTLLGKQKNDYLISRDIVAVLAKESFFSNIFGNGHPYGRTVELKDFDKITTEQLRTFHANCYIPDNLYIVVAGKIPKNTEQLINKYFGNQQRRDLVPLEFNFIPKKPEKRRHTEKANAVQTAIRIGSTTINKCHPDYPGLKVVNTILGGYFGSRLMKNIREDKGFSYGIASSLYSTQQSGIKVIFTEVNQANTNEAIDEILKEVSILGREPIKSDELEIVKNYMLGNLVRSLDGPFALIDNFRSLYEFGLKNDFNYLLEEKIKNISADEIMELVNNYYKIDDLTVVTAGKE